MRVGRWMLTVALLAAGLAAAAPGRADAFAVVGGPTIAAGNGHSLIVRSDGTVLASGWNRHGELGSPTNNGTNIANPTPTVVPGLTGVVAVAAGANHSLALRSDGTVLAFGLNDVGQLGNSTNNNTDTANPTPTVVPDLSGVIALAAGSNHSLALRSDGTVVAFGQNFLGQLGTATNSGSTAPNPTPAVVPGLTDVVAIAAGFSHSLALKNDGTVLAFGSNEFGQLGTTTNTGAATPNSTPTVVPGLTTVTAIAAGNNHSLARRSDGTVLAFGWNFYGQLGSSVNNGNNDPNPTPTTVPGLSSILGLAAGTSHTLARRSDGAVVAFGRNSLGQLGSTVNNGTPTANPTPTALEGVAAATPIAASTFVAVTPTRVLDTRSATRLNHTGAKPGADATTIVTIVGRGGVPADATAITGNLTAVDATGPGFVQAIPSTSGTLKASSNLNVEAAGQTIANAITVPVGTDGAIRLYTESGAHLLLDITGYYVPATGPTSAGRTITVTPTRVLDTRGATKPTAGSTTRVTIAGRGPIPATIAAVVLNVTAVDATTAGFVQVGPAGATTPFAWSNINVGTAGLTIPNQVIAAVSTTGAIDIYTEKGTHLLVDVFGYVTTASATPGTDGLFVPITPTRTLDTRAGNGPARTAGSTVTNNPGALQEIPTNGTSAVAANITITQATNPGYVQAAATGSLVVGASSILNATRAGQTIPNAAVIPTAPASFDLYTESGGHLLADIFGYYTN